MSKLVSYKVFRIIALALGFLPSAFFLIFLIGAGITELLDGKLMVLPILLLMLLTVSGYILAWKRPRGGGIIMSLGGLMMGIYLLIAGGISDLTLASVYSLPFIVPGIMLVLSERYK